MSELDRIRWQCRRGMLELDLVLNRFVEQDLEALDLGQLQEFKNLLAEADTQLLSWVMGQSEVPNCYAKLIRRIRQI